MFGVVWFNVHYPYVWSLRRVSLSPVHFVLPLTGTQIVVPNPVRIRGLGREPLGPPPDL